MAWGTAEVTCWGDRIAWRLVLHWVWGDILVSVRLGWVESGWFPDFLAFCWVLIQECVLLLPGQGWGWVRVGLGEFESTHPHTPPSLRVHECSEFLKLGWGYRNQISIVLPEGHQACYCCHGKACVGSTGKKRQHREGSCMLTVGTGQSTEADGSPGATGCWCYRECWRRRGQAGRGPRHHDCLMVTPRPTSLQTDTCPLYLVLASPPLSPRPWGSPRLPCCLYGGRGGSFNFPCFLNVMSPVYSSNF